MHTLTFKTETDKLKRYNHNFDPHDPYGSNLICTVEASSKQKFSEINTNNSRWKVSSTNLKRLTHFYSDQNN